MALTRPGSINAANPTGNFTTEYALNHTIYLQEVIKEFKERNIMMPLHRVRELTHGKEARFDATWKTDAQYFIPGVSSDLAGNNTVAHNAVTIKVDRLLESDILIPEVDEVMADRDLRQEYAGKQGAALARKIDKHLLQLAVLSARASGVVTGMPDGQSTEIASDTSADNIVDGIIKAVELLDKNDVDVMPGDVNIVLPTTQYYVLMKSGKLLNSDTYGGRGSIATGDLGPIAGLNILKSNNFPVTDISAETGVNNTYHGDFSLSRGVVFHRDALATVRLMDLQYESDYLIQKQATLMVVKNLVGHGILRSDASVELVIPDPEA